MNNIKFTKSIRIVYAIVFFSLVAWAYFAYYTMSEQIKNQEIYAKIINLSGKQRMLSQKTALISNRIFQNDDKKLKAHLNLLIKEMKNDHTFIINNLNTQNMKNIYFDSPYNLNKKVNNYFELLEKYYMNKSEIVLNNILEASYKLLPDLNYAVNEFERQSNEATNSLLQRELYIFLGTLITLLIESIFIVIPIIRKNEEKEEQLTQINASLEDKVKEELDNLKKKDEIIIKQSKMSSMGEMLQSISHQWRQPLSVITTATSGMKLKKEFNDLSDEEFYKFTERIMTNSNYLSQTIDDFMNFFSTNKEKNKFLLENSIKKSLDIIYPKLKNKDIKINQNLQKNCDLLGFENELIQVYLNLLSNSLDAFENIDIENKVIEIKITKENNEFKIEFIDNAGGIDDEIKDNIFDAYFTTKHQSKGTGIGLYMCYEIITKHFDGYINHENITYSYLNKNYEGSKFTITLPINN